MTETTITSDGIVWYRNPWYPKESETKWVNADGFITLFKNGFPSDGLPDDILQAVSEEMAKRKAKNTSNSHDRNHHNF